MINFKMLNKVAVIAAIPLVISACGGDNTKNAINSPQSTYTAIDGYLKQAEVYFDSNQNGVADNDELQGTTDENGIFIGNDSGDSPVIIKIIAGVTSDSDYTGALTQNRELIASPGIKTITPFTTIAHLMHIEMSELAAELGVSLDKIKGDFIANKHDEAHVLARSIYQLLDNELAVTESNISNIRSEVQTIAQFVKASGSTKFNNLIVVLDEDKNPSFTSISDTVSSPVKTEFNFNTAKVKWEQKDFSAHQYQSGGQTFHPCYPHKLSEDKIIASDCFGRYFVVLSANDGRILSSLDLSSIPVEKWYLDENVLIVDANNTTYYYDDTLTSLSSYTPKQSVFLSGNGNFVVNHSQEAQIDNLQLKFPDHKTAKGLWRSNRIAYQVYYTHSPDKQSGANIYTALVDGTLVTKTDVVSESKIKTAVVTAHNNSSSAADFTANANNTFVSYLSQGAFIVRVDTDPRYVSNDYHYMYKDGELHYLGRFYHGRWYGGLDNSTVTWYTNYRSRKQGGAYREPHRFKQFSLANGDLVGSWEKSHSDFEPVLYRQEHSSLGIVSVSDSYSSISLIK